MSKIELYDFTDADIGQLYIQQERHHKRHNPIEPFIVPLQNTLVPGPTRPFILYGWALKNQGAAAIPLHIWSGDSTDNVEIDEASIPVATTINRWYGWPGILFDHGITLGFSTVTAGNQCILFASFCD